MKSLEKLASELNGRARSVQFNFQGIKSFKGYEIIRDDYPYPFIITFEPVYYSNGDRWLIYGGHINGVRYAKNIREAVNIVKSSNI